MRTEDGTGPSVQITVRLPTQLLRTIGSINKKGETRADTIRRMLQSFAANRPDGAAR